MFLSMFKTLCRSTKNRGDAIQFVRENLNPCDCGCKRILVKLPGRSPLFYLKCSFCDWKTRPRKLEDLWEFLSCNVPYNTRS